LSAFRKRNQRRLRKLNDEMIRETTLQFDKIHFNLSVYSYVLSKIVSKPRYLRDECESCLQGIEQAMEKLVRRADSGTEDELERLFTELDKAIACLEERDPRFVVDMMTKGRLKMAATFYAQGLSLGVAAELTGLEKQEILDYAGETMMFDRLKEEKSIHDRMKNARKILLS
jgi:hypothetical protein